MTYNATGTTVSEITGKIVAATVASPSPAGTCVDMTTKIRCTSVNDTTSLSSSASVNYLIPDTTAPIVTLVGGVATHSLSEIPGQTLEQPGSIIETVRALS